MVPSRVPPVYAGGRALRCRCESGLGRSLHWLRSPSQLAMEAVTGLGSADSRLPRGRRCRVAHPWRKRNAGPANPSLRPSLRGSSARGRHPGPGRSPLPRPVSATRRGAGGWRQQPGAGGRRGAATVTAAAGSRAEARAPEGRGCHAPRRPRAPGPPRRPSVQEQTTGSRCVRQARTALVSFSPIHVRGCGEARAHACLSGCASFSCI